MAIRQYMGANYYGAEDLAEMLGVSTKTIYAYLRAGKIKGRKTLRRWWIWEKDIEDYLRDARG